MKLLLVDNYDSFTYNLYHYFVILGCEVRVARNNAFALEEVKDYSHVVLSPGPGLPTEAGLCMEVLKHYAEQKSILGVCLGFQAMAQHFGAKLFNQREVAHGISREVNRIGESWLLDGLPAQFSVGLYHSWAVDVEQQIKFPLRCVAHRHDNRCIMAMEHPKLPLAGVQFHPESIMTGEGQKIIKNWLNRH